MSTIRPHPTHPGWYYLDGRIDGKRERIPCGSYAEALTLQRTLFPAAPDPHKTTHPRLEDVCQEYLLWVQREQSETTHINKEARLRLHIIPRLGRYRVRDLTQTILDDYARTVARTSYRTDLFILLALITWMISRNYAKPLAWQPEIPHYSQKVRPLPSPADMVRFIEALPREHHRIICRLMLYSGLRYAEAKRLRWEHMGLDTILLQHTKTREPFLQPIPPELLPWFHDHRQPSGYIFSVTAGRTPISKLDRPFAIARKKSGVHMTPHLFRHASATFLYEQTRDLYAVQQHLRHKRITTSEIYTRYSDAIRKTALQSVAAHINQHLSTGQSENAE